MSHKGIRLLIENTAKSLGDDIQFTYARPSDFNVLRDKRYPFIACDPITASVEFADNSVLNYSKSWSVIMAFYMLDREASDQGEYSEILDATDILVDKFINKLNTYAYETNTTSDDIIISGISQNPFIKATADILTGHTLSFTIQVSDDFNYCDVC